VECGFLCIQQHLVFGTFLHVTRNTVCLVCEVPVDMNSRNSGNVVSFEPRRFDIGTNSLLSGDKLVAERLQFNEFLSTHGYAVVANAATASDIAQAHCDFWNFCEAAKPALSRADVRTWVEPDWLPSSSTGICAAMGFNHSSFCWNARMLPSARAAFGLIWACLESELIVSFDGGNAFRPWSIDPSWVTKGGWWHVDQNSQIGPSRRGKVCVQGVVLYTDANEHTGGLCVIPGSHLVHSELCARTEAAAVMMDYVEVLASDEVMTLPKVLLCVRAGDFIVWDSRTVHCNTPALSQPPNGLHSDGELPPSPSLLRLASYVCMLPRSHASGVVLAQRQQAFVNRIPSSHWPNKPTRSTALRNPLHPPQNPRECSDEQLLLVGFSAEEIRQLRAAAVV
jgi:hypothetical protein